MNERQCGFSEQELVDYILGSLPGERCARLRDHVAGCRSCRDQMREWMELLSSRQEEALPGPPPRLKTGLKLKYIWLKKLPAFARGMMRSGKAAALAGAVALLFIFLGLFQTFKDSGEIRAPLTASLDRIATEFHPEDRSLTMLVDPKTVQYKMTALNAKDAEGYAWVNRLSDEVFLLIDGLEPSTEKDYQAWFTFNTANIRENGGILKWKKGMAHLYVHGGKISGADNITISLEPKGGSFAPIGPDTLLVILEK